MGTLLGVTPNCPWVFRQLTMEPTTKGSMARSHDFWENFPLQSGRHCLFFGVLPSFQWSPRVAIQGKAWNGKNPKSPWLSFNFDNTSLPTCTFRCYWSTADGHLAQITLASLGWDRIESKKTVTEKTSLSRVSWIPDCMQKKCRAFQHPGKHYQISIHFTQRLSCRLSQKPPIGNELAFARELQPQTRPALPTN